MSRFVRSFGFLTFFLFFFCSTSLAAPPQPKSLEEWIAALTFEEADCIETADVMENEVGVATAVSKYCCKTSSGIREITTCYGCNDCVKRLACMRCCAAKCRLKADREGCEGGCPS